MKMLGFLCFCGAILCAEFMGGWIYTTGEAGPILVNMLCTGILLGIGLILWDEG